MLNPVAAKSIIVVTVVVLAASQAAFLPPLVQKAKATPRIESARHQPLAKGDRLPAFLKGAACSSRGWPYYEQRCLFDRRSPASESPTIRVIALR